VLEKLPFREIRRYAERKLPLSLPPRDLGLSRLVPARCRRDASNVPALDSLVWFYFINFIFYSIKHPPSRPRLMAGGASRAALDDISLRGSAIYRDR